MTDSPTRTETSVVAVALHPDGTQEELTTPDFHINQLKYYYKVIGGGCEYVTPITLQYIRPALVMWVDEDAKIRNLPINEYATIIMASFTHRVIDIAGTVIFTGTVSNRIYPIHSIYLAHLREAEELRQSIARHPSGKKMSPSLKHQITRPSFKASYCIECGQTNVSSEDLCPGMIR